MLRGSLALTARTGGSGQPQESRSVQGAGLACIREEGQHRLEFLREQPRDPLRPPTHTLSPSLRAPTADGSAAGPTPGTMAEAELSGHANNSPPPPLCPASFRPFSPGPPGAGEEGRRATASVPSRFPASRGRPEPRPLRLSWRPGVHSDLTLSPGGLVRGVVALKNIFV